MPSSVKLAVKSVEIPTYVLGPDSPYPPLPWQRGHYPYSVRLDLSTQTRPVRHRVIVLENQYVRAEILPDMGGRLYRLFDKQARQETFMVPPTVKFQNIALRGAWIAGGIEWNFGRAGHTVNSVDPVSWTTARQADGSACVYVGATIRPMESRWSVRIRLRPGRTALDVQILTQAPRELPGMMYWWTNTAVEVTQQSKFIFYGLHAGDEVPHSWPMTDGLDFRWYRNRIMKADMFLMEPQRDYLGFYDYTRRHGLASWADRQLAPGQKYFTWGADMRGKYWDLQLSDTEQTYCEIQRGRLPTQGKTEPIPPMSADTWSETWMPIHNTGGFEHVENEMVLSVNPHARGAEVVLLSAIGRENLRVKAYHNDKPLGGWRIATLGAGQANAHTLALANGRKCNRVVVSDAGGNVLMNWREFVFTDEDWTRMRPGFDLAKAGLEEIFEEAQRRRFYTWPTVGQWALDLFNKVLSIDPGHSGALRALAEMDLFNGLYERARERIELALKRRPGDPELRMLLGWTLLRLAFASSGVAGVSPLVSSAREQFTLASRYQPWRRNALVGLAWACVADRDLDAAQAALDQLLTESPTDRWGRFLQVLILRKQGHKPEATTALAALQSDDPLWAPATAEALLLGLPADLANGTRRLADDSVTAAMPYLEMGLWDDAARVLQVDESDEPFSPMLRLTHLAYAQLKAGRADSAAKTLKQAAKAPLAQAVPWSTTSLAMLEELVKLEENTEENTGDRHQFRKQREISASPHLHAQLGNILASRFRTADAVAAWKRAIDLGLEHTILYANLASASVQLGKKDQALKYYRRAWQLSGCELHLFSEMDRFLSQQGLHAERQRMYEQLDEAVRGRSIVGIRRVPQLLDLQRYESALAELAGRQFLSGEAAEYRIRRCFLEAVMGRSVELIARGRWQPAHELLKQGLTYPRNHNAGRRFIQPEEAMMNYMLGLTAEALGRPDEATRYWTAAAHEQNMDGELFQAYEMLAWLALGNVPRVVDIAHKLEALAHGERAQTWWFGVLNTPSMKQLVHGLGQLTKGRVAEAQAMWKKALAAEPDARFLRPHLLMPRHLLERMARKLTSTDTPGRADGPGNCSSGRRNPA